MARMEAPAQEKSLPHPHVPFNFLIGLLDGGFFGLGIGFGSFVAVIPLFLTGLTTSALLIGLAPAIHNVGWQFPQLFTAGWVSRARRYKPMMLWMTIHERIPFLGMAAVAWFMPQIGAQWALLLMFPLMVWQGVGGGLAGNAWQSMITKVIPEDLHGTFFGTQAAAFNGLAGVSAILAGILLERLPYPQNFALCFALAAAALGISFLFISQTRERESPVKPVQDSKAFWKSAQEVLRRDRNFSVFLGVRSLSQFASMAFSFYLIYAVLAYGMSAGLAGIMTGVLLIAQVAFSPLMGRLGDRWSHRGAMGIGALAAMLSALVAWRADSVTWFYLVFLLEAVAIVAIYTVPIALTVSFARQEEDRPLYIGLSHTLTAPATIVAPIVGGLIADAAGFHLTFLLSAACALLMAAALVFAMKEPHQGARDSNAKGKKDTKEAGVFMEQG